MRKNGIYRICPVCEIRYYVKNCYVIADKYKHCSIKCDGISKRGIIPANIKIAQSKSPIGKIGNSYHVTGEKHWAWQKENPSYRAVHEWIRKKYGNANKCENKDCVYPRNDARGNLMIFPKSYQWANISREYHRDRADFIQLCASCHKKFDLEYSKSNKVH